MQLLDVFTVTHMFGSQEDKAFGFIRPLLGELRFLATDGVAMKDVGNTMG